MTEDQSIKGSDKENQKSWLNKLANLFTDEPQNKDDLLAILMEAHHNALLDIDALNMMKGALKVADLQVRQVMIPRAQMVVIPLTSNIEEVLPIIVESGHSRFPVVGEDKDELEGILLAKDILKSFVKGEQDFDLREILRPAVVIPESKQVNILLNEFRTSRNHMAIIIDEYGGVAGLVTIEDILEVIVGEIDDEYDNHEDPYIMKISDKLYRVNALTTIEEFNEAFDSNFNDSEFDTIGGLVASEAGRLPETGEEIWVENLMFKIIKSDKRRIEFVQVDFS
ncbi:HlyC/CorC family transporter [Marinicella litoralis]|uniref:Magnesium and cobalt efflux protein CorC n=1 Tax=Marinicella litoralis TaxID=644220 RepID=A0A4R6XG72_9GAMM|nr:transporter associated domain-containing protein [Marinicella litoralis]TDR18385.1 Mg2+/Co2+ transporter CorC [Marinicella litoralis]